MSDDPIRISHPFPENPFPPPEPPAYSPGLLALTAQDPADYLRPADVFRSLRFGVPRVRPLSENDLAPAFPEPPPSEAPLLSGRDVFRSFLYTTTRFEFAQVYRPGDPRPIRQLVASVGVPPLGRLAARFTLHDLTHRPTAAHLEVILGIRAYSIGASVGRSQNEVIFNWFRRNQPSYLTTSRELTRVIVEGGRAQVQTMGELKFYNSSLYTTELGRAVTYQLEREHLREAYRRLRWEGADSAAQYLKQHYPYIDESLVRRGMVNAPRAHLGFAAEMGVYLAVGVAVDPFIPEGPLRHAVQNGAGYAVSNLFRGGLAELGAGKILLSMAEAVPLSLIHMILSRSLRHAERRFDFQIPCRGVLEDVGSLAIYARARPFLGLGSLLARTEGAAYLGLEAVQAARIVRGALLAGRFLRASSGIIVFSMLLGGLIYLTND